MKEQFQRSELILGQDNMEKIFGQSVAVFGLGGVGSYAAEALGRAGIGKLFLIDNDTVNASNINRQLPALHSTVGRLKVEVVKERLKDINPDLEIFTISDFFDDTNSDMIFELFKRERVSYIIDAIDSVKSKLHLIQRAKQANIKIVSSMGTGNKIRPELLKVTTIDKTSMCPLARKIRKFVKDIGEQLTVVYSTEEPMKPNYQPNATEKSPGSTAFVPSTAGLMLASLVVRDIIEGGVIK